MVKSTNLLILGLIVNLYACEDPGSNVSNDVVEVNQLTDSGQMGEADQGLQDQEVILAPIIVPEFGRATERKIVALAHRSD